MKRFIFASIALLALASFASACPLGVRAVGGGCGVAASTTYAAPAAIQQQATTYTVPQPSIAVTETTTTRTYVVPQPPLTFSTQAQARFDPGIGYNTSGYASSYADPVPPFVPGFNYNSAYDSGFTGYARTYSSGYIPRTDPGVGYYDSHFTGYVRSDPGIGYYGGRFYRGGYATTLPVGVGRFHQVTRISGQGTGFVGGTAFVSGGGGGRFRQVTRVSGRF